jgi:hypothetical protein
MVIVVVMIVMVMMVIAMIVRCMVMRRMLVRIVLARVGVTAGIGAAFGIEWRLDLDHARAQASDHRFDNVIAPDAQALRHDLRRQMPVAEMPGNANQMMRVAPPDLDQWLRRRDHLDQPPVFQHQGIAAAQRDGVFQIEQE